MEIDATGRRVREPRSAAEFIAENAVADIGTDLDRQNRLDPARVIEREQGIRDVTC